MRRYRRVLVTGSRDWADYKTISEALYQACSAPMSMVCDGMELVVTVVHGAAPGADTLASRWVKENPRPCPWVVVEEEPHPADWKKHKKAAGPIRNIEMVKLGAWVCLAFPLPDSVGTWHCIRASSDARIPVRIFPPEHSS